MIRSSRNQAKSKKPWNDSYHRMGHTYGTWLPGDPKGFRTRHHREHVEGDYKNPPPKGKYDRRWQHSKDLMRRDAVILTREQRRIAVNELLKSFRKWGVEVVAFAVDAVHFHILARFPAHNPRHFIGLAKKESSAYMKQRGEAPEGGLWGTRTQCVPISDRSHQLRVAKYIFAHRTKNAVVFLISISHTCRATST